MKVNDIKSVKADHLNCVWDRLVHLPSLKETSRRKWNTVNIHMTTVVHESSSVSRPSSHQPHTHTHWTLCKQTLAGENRSLDHHHHSCKHRCAENRVMKQKQTKLNRKYSRTWTNRLHISTTGAFKEIKKKKKKKYFKIKEESRDLIYEVQIWMQINNVG